MVIVMNKYIIVRSHRSLYDEGNILVNHIESLIYNIISMTIRTFIII